MFASEDSLVASAKPSVLKPIIVVVAAVSVASMGWWLFVRGTGQPENPARVLIVGPTPQLAGFLEHKGFDVDYLSFGAAVGEGQAFDSSLGDLAAIVEYADQSGIGYVALSMAHGETYEFDALDYVAEGQADADAPPPGTTFAVISVGDLGRHLSYGGVVPSVVHAHPVDEQVGLLLGLFGQPAITKARTLDASNDLMIRFGSAGTVEDVVAYEKAQQTMRREMAAWDALTDKDRGEPKPTEIAVPYERLRGWPLANGAVLLGSGRGAWASDDGLVTTWRGDDLQTQFSVVQVDSLGERGPCETLPETLALDEGFAIAQSGDAMLIPSNAYVADLWVLTGDGCGFEKRDEIRRLQGGELGQPRANGRTAAAQFGRVNWADAKMRAYRNVSFAGVEPRSGALRWVGDDLVVVPAALRFFDGAIDAQQRRIAAASESGAAVPGIEPIDADTLPDDSEALVFVRLPAPKQEDLVELAVVPVDALVTAAGEPEDLTIRAVFPLAAQPGTVVVQVDGPEGPVLVRVRLGESGPAWQNGLGTDYLLPAASEAGREAVEVTVLSNAVPPEALDLTISPTGSHAAWVAPFGEGRGDPLHEIVVLALDPSAKPIRLTNNDRRDSKPRFAGEDGRTVIFDSAYVGADTLPEVEAVRALALPD